MKSGDKTSRWMCSESCAVFTHLLRRGLVLIVLSSRFSRDILWNVVQTSILKSSTCFHWEVGFFWHSDIVILQNNCENNGKMHSIMYNENLLIA